jgi:DNA-directed RNA polymerase subunit RPC12/RpoP
MYKKCKNCHCRQDGTTVYRCRNCGKIFCSNCLPDSACSDCDGEWLPTLVSKVPFMPDNLKSIGEISH